MRLVHLLLTRFLTLTVLCTMGLFPVAGSAASVIRYHVPLFTKDLPFNSPTNQWSFWFDKKPGMALSGDPQLELYYTYSDTLHNGMGSITVILNDVPIASRLLPGKPGEAMPWRVTLPKHLFKEGFNEIRLVSRQRTFEGLCRDIDHAANWLRFYKTSMLHMTVEVLSVYPLFTYPFPLLDEYAPTPANCTWFLPSSPSTKEIETMLYVASDWGNREPERPMKIRVSTEDPGANDESQVIFGTSDRLSRYSVKPLSDTGYLEMLPGEGSRQYARLLVSGGDIDGLEKAHAALASPDYMAQIETASVDIDRKLEVKPHGLAVKEGKVTLKDLGYPTITLAGAFHVRSSIVLKRPVLLGLGRLSKFVIAFRHSANLLKERSLITIYINGIPVASQKMTPENANNALINATIPVSELAKNIWVIEFACYHELGTVDCSKRYDEVAWTLIDGEKSYFLLTKGALRGVPYLEYFPYVNGRTGRPISEPITMWLSANPTDAELSAAATIAARAGQANRMPLRWKVVLGDKPDRRDLAKACVIMLAYPDEPGRFQGLRGKIPVAPTEGGGVTLHPENLNFVKDNLKSGADAVLLQASINPYNEKNGLLYVAMATSDAAMNRLCTLLADPDTLDKIKGEVCLLSARGRVEALYTRSQEEIEKELIGESESYTPPMWIIVALFALLLVLAIVFFIRRFMPRPAPPAPPSQTTPWEPTPVPEPAAVAESSTEPTEPEPVYAGAPSFTSETAYSTPPSFSGTVPMEPAREEPPPPVIPYVPAPGFTREIGAGAPLPASPTVPRVDTPLPHAAPYIPRPREVEPTPPPAAPAAPAEPSAPYSTAPYIPRLREVEPAPPAPEATQRQEPVIPPGAPYIPRLREREVDGGQTPLGTSSMSTGPYIPRLRDAGAGSGPAEIRPPAEETPLTTWEREKKKKKKKGK